MRKTCAIGVVVTLVLFSVSVSHAEIRFTPRLSAGVEWTDNLFLTNDNPGSEAESERIAVVSPGMTIEFAERTASLSLRYDPRYSWHDKFEQRDYWEHDAALAANWQASRRLRFDVGNNYLHSEDLIDDEDLTIRRSQQPYMRNTSTARMEYQFGSENNFYLDGLYTFLENDDPAVEDSQRFGGGVGVEYWFSIRWGVELAVQAYRAEYDQETLDYDDYQGSLRLNHRFNQRLIGFLGYRQTLYRFEDDSNDSEIYDGSAGFELAIDPTMDLAMEVHHFVRDVDGSRDESETPVNLTFEKRFQRGSLEIGGEGGYNRTSVSAEELGYYVYYAGSVVGTYDFTRRISGDMEAGYTYRDYKDTTPSREDDVMRAGCGLTIDLTQWLSARLGYTFRAIESNIEANDYKEHRGSLYFTIAPPQPFRL